MIARTELIAHLDELLTSERIRDYAPNGLQVEGVTSISRIVTGVSACQALIDEAIARDADALLVHHGYFWKNESPLLVGMKRQRVLSLLENGINLIAYHLPLDVHPSLGNNAQLAQLLGIEVKAQHAAGGQEGLLWIGELAEAKSLGQFSAHVASCLGRVPLAIDGGGHMVRHVAWCSGGAQGYIEQAHALGADLYLSGEISEPTVHQSRELGIHYLSAGHHATERYGVQALGDHLAARFGLEHHYVEIENPV